MNADQANSPRTLGKAGTYEVWYVTASLPAERRGFWIRYSTFRPRPGLDLEPHCALWAFSFHHDDPSRNSAAKAVFPISAFSAASSGFDVQIGASTLDSHGCRGAFETDTGEAHWDLRWHSLAAPFAFLEGPLARVASAHNIAANPALEISGKLEVGGVEYRLDKTSGGQQHTWGSRHALEWNWGYASGFGHDNGAWFDGVTTRVRSSLGRLMKGTSVGAHFREISFKQNHGLSVVRSPGAIDPNRWDLEIAKGGLILVATVRPRPEDLIGVTYQDPQGGTRVCYHSEVADLVLSIHKGTRSMSVESLPSIALATHLAAAAFEYASESALAGLPPVLL